MRFGCLSGYNSDEPTTFTKVNIGFNYPFLNNGSGGLFPQWRTHLFASGGDSGQSI